MPPVKGKKRGPNAQWEGDQKRSREVVIKEYAQKVIQNKRENSGKLAYGFVAKLCKGWLGLACKLTSNDINNEVRRIEKHERERRNAESSAVNLLLNSNKAAKSTNPSIAALARSRDEVVAKPNEPTVDDCCFPFCDAVISGVAQSFASCTMCGCDYHVGCLNSWETWLHFDGEEIDVCYSCHREAYQEFYSSHLESNPTRSDVILPIVAIRQASSSSQPSSSSEVPVATGRKKAGRPRGSTNAKKEAQKRAKIDATNWVVCQYTEAKTAAKNEGTKCKTGLRQELVEKAKEKFDVEDDTFDVKHSMIDNRATRGRLEVAHRGVVPPLAAAEVILTGYITSAARVNSPLSVNKCIALMTALIIGTVWEETHCIDFKKRQVRHLCRRSTSPLHRMVERILSEEQSVYWFHLVACIATSR